MQSTESSDIDQGRVEQSADAPGNVSRRLMLSAGAAGALMAAGCSPRDVLPPSLCTEAWFTTVVTPPRTRTTIIENRYEHPPSSFEKAMRPAGDTRTPVDLINAEVKPFKIAPSKTVVQAALTSDEQARASNLARLSEDDVRNRIVCSLWKRTSCKALPGAGWDSKMGVGPSVVTLFRDAAQTKPVETIEIPGVPLETIQDSILHMRTDPSRWPQMDLQVTYPHVYLAAALSLDERVRKLKESEVSWSCHVINCVGLFATLNALAIKDVLKVPRPRDIVSTAPLPIIDVPDYSAYPGGHATFLAALHVILVDITGATPTQAGRFRGLSDRIAENRELAGLHTRLDTRAGQEFGTALAQAMLRWMDQIDDIEWGIVYKCAKAEWIKK